MGILLTTTTDAANAGSAAGSLIMLIFWIAMLAIMWFFLMRPQKKEQKRIAAMLAELEVGDCVLTTAGFYGVVIDISDDTVIVEFGNNKNCRIPMQRAAITNVEKPEK